MTPLGEFLGFAPKRTYMSDIQEQLMCHDRFMYSNSEQESDAEESIERFGYKYKKQDSNISGVTEYILNINNDEYNCLSGIMHNYSGLLLSPERRSDFGYIGEQQIGFKDYNTASIDGTGFTTFYTDTTKMSDGKDDTQVGIKKTSGSGTIGTTTLTIDFNLSKTIYLNKYQFSAKYYTQGDNYGTAKIQIQYYDIELNAYYEFLTDTNLGGGDITINDRQFTNSIKTTNKIKIILSGILTDGCNKFTSYLQNFNITLK